MEKILYNSILPNENALSASIKGYGEAKPASALSYGEAKENGPGEMEIIAITDTHNDTEAIKRNLHLHDVVDKDGEWKKKAHNIRIIHTGDVINKEKPEKKSLEYIFHLKETAPETCSVEVLAGNHEISYTLGKNEPPEKVGSKREFIAKMSVVSSEGPILFIHGYPTIELLREILSHGSREEGIKAINEQFREAMRESISGNHEKLKRFSYAKSDGSDGEHPLFWKVLPKDYYLKNGKETEELLEKLGIDIVVHGHVSRQEGVQDVGEFQKNNLMTNTTFINNDVRVSDRKKLDPGETGGNAWGSLKINLNNGHNGEMAVSGLEFVNKNTYNKLYPNKKLKV